MMKTTNTPRFLLIDDDKTNILVCSVLIKQYLNIPDVRSYTLPEKAVEYIQDDFTNDPKDTVVLLDINMPVYTGWDVLEFIDKLDEDVKKHLAVYILSSSIDQRDIQKAVCNPYVFGYLEKPLTKSKLESIVAWKEVN